VSRAKKERVKDRVAGEQLVGISVLSNGFSKQKVGRGVWAVMAELDCEMDFVARNQLFGALLDDIAHTPVLISDSDAYHTILDSKTFLDKLLSQLRYFPLVTHHKSLPQMLELPLTR